MSKGNFTARRVHKEKGFEVVEYPPQVRTIMLEKTNLRSAGSGRQVSRVSLPFPYMQFIRATLPEGPDFVYHISSALFLTFSNEPIENLDGIAHFPALPNVYNTLMVCLGQQEKSGSHNKGMRKLIELFWNTTFYHHHGWLGCASLRQNGLSNYKSWQKRESVVDVDWGNPVSLRYLRNYILDETEVPYLFHPEAIPEIRRVNKTWFPVGGNSGDVGRTPLFEENITPRSYRRII